jgi:O-antigen ligase/tetratricopeptide (TPR) repeat protein
VRSQSPRRSLSSVDGYARSRLRHFGVAVLCAKLALVPLIFDFSLDMPFAVSKAMVSHGLAYMLAAVMVGLFIQFGQQALRWSLIHVPALLFLAVNALAAIFAVDRELAFYGTHARMLGLGSIADCVVLYLAIVMLIRSRVEVIMATTSALGAAVVVLGYEAVQLLRMDPLRWSIDGSTRPFSTLGQATSLAQYLASLSIAAVACGLFADRMRLAVRVLIVVYAGVLVIGSLATGTRSALIGIAAGLAVMLLFVWLQHPNRRVRAISALGGIGAAAVLGGLVLFTPIGARLGATFVEGSPVEGEDDVLDRLEPSAAGRLTLYGIGLQMVGERPILGYGPDNFTVGVPRYRPELAPVHVRQSLPTSAHSWVVQVAATSGLTGLVCFLAIVAVALGIAVRRGFQPATIAAGATLSAFLGTGLTTVNELGTDWIFWASVGTIAAATANDGGATRTSQRPRREGRHRESDTLRRIAPAVIVTGSLLLAATGWGALEASRAARASQEARLLGRTQSGIDLGLSATRSDAERATYWHTLGLAFIAARRWQEASDAFDRARRLAPYDVRYIADLVQAQLLLVNAGDGRARTRALQHADEAVAVDPNNPRSHLTRAVAMQVTGNLPEALRSVDRALALDPGSTNARLYITAAQIKLAASGPADAIGLAREGLLVLGSSRESVLLRIELARALVAIAKPAEALAELDIALSIHPENVAAQRLKAEITAALPRQ